MMDQERKQKILRQINKLRKNPKHLVPSLEKILPLFVSEYQIFIDNFLVKTIQGKKAWIQAIEFLKNQQELDELQWVQGLSQAAKKYSKYTQENSSNKEISDKNTIFQSLQKYVDYKGEVKLQTHSSRNSIKQFIRNIIISDGDNTRQSRNIIFNSKFKYFGSYIDECDGEGIKITYYLAENVINKKKQKTTATKVIKQINKLRRDPKSFLPDIKNQVLLFKKKQIRFNEYTVQTFQGKKAWLQAIEYLKNKQPVPQIQYLKELNKIALKKVKYPTIQFSKFLIKFSNIKGKARYIQNYSITDPRQIVVSLIISDGDITRSSRNTILSQQFNYIGGFLDTGTNIGCGLLLIQKQKQNFIIPRLRSQKGSINNAESTKDLKEFEKKESLKKIIQKRLIRSTSNNILPPIHSFKQFKNETEQNLDSGGSQKLIQRIQRKLLSSERRLTLERIPSIQQKLIRKKNIQHLTRSLKSVELKNPQQS